MQEQIIGFELAKLAKEKGFNWPVINFYTPNVYLTNAEGYQTERLKSSNWNNGQGSYPTEPEDVECSAPTQSLLQKWLREKHNIHVEIELTDTTTEFYYQHTIVDSKNREYHDKDMTDQAKSITNWELKFTTFEGALEDGLFKALKLI